MKIPKIFHQIWLGNNPFPEEFILYKQTWENLHPDWDFWFWRDDNLQPLIHQDLFDNAELIVAKANMLRVEVLNKYGGVYLDTDFECYKNIEPLIEDLDIFSCGEKDGIIGNAIMGSVPEHPTWQKVMAGWAESMEKHKEYPSNIQNGVVYMTKRLNKDDITLLPSKYFFPTPVGTVTDIGLSECFPEAYGHHHWAASWVTEKAKQQWIEWAKENGGDQWYE